MSKRPRTYWDSEEAEEVLSEWRASGLSVKAFAKKTGLRRNRLNWWRKRLGDWSEEGAPGESSLKLVPLIPSEVVVSPRMRGAVTMRLPGGAELEFDDAQMSPEWVAAVAREVARAR
jgi:transposase-like protein